MHAEGAFVGRSLYPTMEELSIAAILRLASASNQSGTGERFYGVADQLVMEGLAKQLRICQFDSRNLFDCTTESGAYENGPVLFNILPLANTHLRGFLRWLTSCGKYSSCLLFLSSPLDIDQLAQRLRYRLAATLPDGISVLLRYYDGRVFESLMQYLSIEQARTFLGFGSCWWFVDRKGMLQSVRGQCDLKAEDVPLILSPAQEAELVHASEPDQVAELLRAVVPNEYSDLGECNQFEFIVRHMKAARMIGIESTRELALFCSLALVYGEDFADRDIWSSALSEVAAGRISLTSALHTIDLLDMES